MISDNVVIVYELLEEMLDNGFPLATESNVLKEMIKPPTILRSVVNTLTGKQSSAEDVWTADCSPINQTSPILMVDGLVCVFCVFSRRK